MSRDMWIGVGVSVGGWVVVVLLLVGVMWVAAVVAERRRRGWVPSTNPVDQDRVMFASPEARDRAEAEFWGIVGPICKRPLPVVPGDGGEPRWTR